MKSQHISEPLYTLNTSGSRVLKPSSEIHNFIVRKIYYLYKKEFYKNSFKKVNIHISLHFVNLPNQLQSKSTMATCAFWTHNHFQHHQNSKTVNQSFRCHKYTYFVIKNTGISHFSVTVCQLELYISI